jgi:hypothetical protein
MVVTVQPLVNHERRLTMANVIDPFIISENRQGFEQLPRRRCRL